MNNKYSYVGYGLRVSIAFLLTNLLLGHFYTFVKSLFFIDIDSVQVFIQSVEKMSWLKPLLTASAIGLAAGVYKRYQDKKPDTFEKAQRQEKSKKYPFSSLPEIQSRAMAWWLETGHKHWGLWGIWILIALCLVTFLFSSDFLEGTQSAQENFTRGYKLAHGVANTETYIPSLIISLVIGIPILLFFVAFFGKAAGRLHYFLIYKPILRRYNTANIVLYFMMSVVIYNTFLVDFVFTKIMDVSNENKDVLAYGIWVFSLMFSIIYDYKKKEGIQKALEKERNEAQIQALKAQINPHFLFNTLNNLYGTALVEQSSKTAEGIQQLAQIMRHAVESSQQDKVDIEREIRFLHNYIELQQIRIPKRDNIQIHTDIRWDEQPATLTPLILMTFVENAFKYGINPTQPCSLIIQLTVEKNQLTFVCRNNIVTRTQFEPGTGMGIENTLKRLNLLYPDRHTIRINQTDEVYEVFLTIQLT